MKRRAVAIALGLGALEVGLYFAAPPAMRWWYPAAVAVWASLLTSWWSARIERWRSQ